MGAARELNARPSSRAPRPWLFALAAAPYGSFNGLVAVGLPYMLHQRGIPVERIAAIEAVVQAPAIWFFLWGPVVDLKLRRRTWLVLLSAATAAFVGAAFVAGAASSLRWITVSLVVASVFNQPVSSAIGGLAAAIVPEDRRGLTAGWSQAGIFGAGVVSGGAMVGLSGHALSLAALVATACIIVPSLAVFAIPEPVPEPTSLARNLASMFRDVRRTLARPEVWLGLLFFASPIGAGALMDLFSAVSSDFHAGTGTVEWVVVLGGVLTPTGALVGGFICDRMDRWLVYPIAGLTAAFAAGVMTIAPLSPTTFLIGAASYALTIGFCYSAFMALALDLVGSRSVASGTRFTLFMAAVNIPVVYMLRVDGWGHAHFGVRGMLAADAVSNAAFAVLFLALLYGTRHTRAAGRSAAESAVTRPSMSSFV
jgi:MFS family permease